MAISQAFNAAGGTFPNVASRANGSQWVNDRHARYMEAVMRGNCYTGSNVMATPVTTQAGLSATTPALTIYNPTGSGVYLSLLSVSIGCTAAPSAATVFALAWNLSSAAAPATTTAGTITNNQIGNTGTGQAFCYAIATLATAPVVFCYLGGPTGAAAISSVNPWIDLAGAYQIMPGVAISIQSKTAAAILSSITWEEIPTSAV